MMLSVWMTSAWYRFFYLLSSIWLCSLMYFTSLSSSFLRIYLAQTLFIMVFMSFSLRSRLNTGVVLVSIREAVSVRSFIWEIIWISSMLSSALVVFSRVVALADFRFVFTLLDEVFARLTDLRLFDRKLCISVVSFSLFYMLLWVWVLLPMPCSTESLSLVMFKFVYSKVSFVLFPLCFALMVLLILWLLLVVLLWL